MKRVGSSAAQLFDLSGLSFLVREEYSKSVPRVQGVRLFVLLFGIIFLDSLSFGLSRAVC